jgi:Uma2 family endonuclease
MATAVASAPTARRTDHQLVLDKVCELFEVYDPTWRVALSDVTWEEYERLLDARKTAERRAVHITYDRGEVEIMTISFRHERYKSTLARMFEALCYHLAIPICGAGGMTVRREDLDRGFEPDECYYHRNLDRVIAKDELNFQTDPPPDLAIEVEVTRTVVARLPIYAAMGIPEVWRYDGERITVLLLTDGRYQESPTSPTVPNLPLAELAMFITRMGKVDDTTLRREFQDWINANVKTVQSD